MATMASTESEISSENSTANELYDISEDNVSPPFYIMKIYNMFSDYNLRLKSFVTWPYHYHAITLAKAGFFYIGYEDYVICYCCAVELYDWENPFIRPHQEHCLQSNRCSFLKTLKISTCANYMIRTKKRIKSYGLPDKYNELFEKLSVKIDKEKCQLNLFTNSIDRLIINKYSSLVKWKKKIREQLVYLKRLELVASTEDQYNKILENIWECVCTYMQDNTVLPIEYSLCPNTIDEEDVPEKANTTCAICLFNKIKILFIPCKHLSTCKECSVKVINCPICKQEIWIKQEVIISGA